MTFTYTRDRPNPPNNPSSDVPDMLQNTNSIDDLLAVDHNSFNVANGGYHKIVHLAKQSGSPAPIANIVQVFNKDYTPDTTGGVAGTQLFSTNSGGTVQLTGTSQQTDGWCWSGGLLFQWGRKTGLSGAWPTTDQTLTFKDRVAGAIRFPGNCFMVVVTFIGPTSSSTGDICINSISSTVFHWQFTGSASTAFDGFYWYAVGN